MGTRKKIPKKLRKAWLTLTKPPFAEVLLLLAVLIGVQQVYTVFDSDITDNKATANAESATSDPAADTILSSLPKNITALADIINDSDAMVHHSTNYTVSTSAIEGIAAPTILVLASANSGTEKYQGTNLHFRASDAPKNSKFAFASTLNQQLFEAVSNTPISITSLLAQPTAAKLMTGKQRMATMLAVWDNKKRLSFATRPSAIKQNISKVPRDKFVIMLDPGHGGIDPGSIGHNGLAEKTLTLDIAKRAERILEQENNIRVILTRDGDIGMSRKERVERVKNSYADMVISLHLNHLPQTDVNLVETYYAAPHNIEESLRKQREARKGFLKTNQLKRDLSFTEGSKQLASLMQKSVYEEVIKSNPSTENAGIKEDTLYILTRSFTPGVLIEMSCLSNINEAERLVDPAYREQLAEALARGVREYLQSAEGKRMLGAKV